MGFHAFSHVSKCETCSFLFLYYGDDTIDTHLHQDHWKSMRWISIIILHPQIPRLTPQSSSPRSLGLPANPATQQSTVRGQYPRLSMVTNPGGLVKRPAQVSWTGDLSLKHLEPLARGIDWILGFGLGWGWLSWAPPVPSHWTLGFGLGWAGLSWALLLAAIAPPVAMTPPTPSGFRLSLVTLTLTQGPGPLDKC